MIAIMMFRAIAPGRWTCEFYFELGLAVATDKSNFDLVVCSKDW